MLRNALSSVLGQTHLSLSITVADNGTDPPANLGELSTDARVRLLSTRTTMSRVANYNRALLSGSNPYVAILADDDEWFPGFVETAAEIMDAHPQVVLVHAGYVVIDAAANRMFTVDDPLSHQDAIISGTKYIELLLTGYNRIETTSTLLRRSALPAGGFRIADDVADDTGLFLRVAMRGDVAVIARPLATVRFHDETVSALGSHGPVSHRYERSAAYRAACRQAKITFIEESSGSWVQRLRWTHMANGALRRNLLIPAARSLRRPSDPRRAWRLLVEETKYAPLARIDPAAWKRAVAAYIGQ